VTTNKSATKKSWRKPKLTVLVRGKPEEMVLAAGCKRSDGGGSGHTVDACTVSTACNAAIGS
jgi:hypothetical protein